MSFPAQYVKENEKFNALLVTARLMEYKVVLQKSEEDYYVYKLDKNGKGFTIVVNFSNDIEFGYIHFSSHTVKRSISVDSFKRGNHMEILDMIIELL